MQIKKNVHRSGALATILSEGKLKPIEIDKLDTNEKSLLVNKSSFLFETNLSIENACLIQLMPNECHPWKYANRREEELGDIKALAASLKNDGQQEPILVRKTNDRELLAKNIKYEVIFGRRRWQAASMLNLPLIAILKELTDQEAALAQKAENKHREPVSPYSEAMHYNSLLEDNCFKSELELSIKLDIPKSTLYDLMAFTKIPDGILNKIPNLHSLSINLAVTMYKLIREDKTNIEILINLAPLISKSITSAKKLRQRVLESSKIGTSNKNSIMNVSGENGVDLFSIRENSRGVSYIVLHKASRAVINIDELCEVMKNFIEEKAKGFEFSGTPEKHHD